MARIQRNLAKKTNNFETIDKELAYAVFIIEKEFHVGAITHEFLAMKFWNLFDETNINRYSQDMSSQMKGKGGGNIPNTF